MLYQCIEISSMEVFLNVVSTSSLPPFQPLCHQRKFCHVSLTSCDPLYTTNTSHREQEIFIYEYALHRVLLSEKNAQQNTALR
jgi:hypothetical protein